MNLLMTGVMKGMENLGIADNEAVLAPVHEYEDKSKWQQRKSRNKPKCI